MFFFSPFQKSSKYPESDDNDSLPPPPPPEDDPYFDDLSPPPGLNHLNHLDTLPQTTTIPAGTTATGLSPEKSRKQHRSSSDAKHHHRNGGNGLHHKGSNGGGHHHHHHHHHHRHSKSSRADSVLSSDSDIRFTRRKLGDNQKCGCALIAGFLLILLFAGVIVYVGCKYFGFVLFPYRLV